MTASPTPPPADMVELAEKHRGRDGLHCLCRPLVDAAERRVAELTKERGEYRDTWHAAEDALDASSRSLAAAARENERLTEECERFADECVRLGLELEAALAAETRSFDELRMSGDTSHLIPIPGKPGGFTNRDYPRPSAETLEPEGE